MSQNLIGCELTSIPASPLSPFAPLIPRKPFSKTGSNMGKCPRLILKINHSRPPYLPFLLPLHGLPAK